MKIQTPYYLIDEKKILKNLKRIKLVKDISGAKFLLALKCFATWATFPLMRQYLDGTTTSSLYEARLGFEKFRKEVHAYSVGYSKEDIDEVINYADKIIFNSVSQLNLYYDKVKKFPLGLRVNPKISYSNFDLADPARKYSRLGVISKKDLIDALPKISGLMFHFNCENNNFKFFSNAVDYISKKYEYVLKKIKWVSLGGGIYFTKDNYPLEEFALKLKEFSNKFNLQVYLEPGESVITESGYLITKVVDIVHNKLDIAIVDASTEAHMLDLLIYRTPAKIEKEKKGKYKYIIAGRSCLAGDVFGTFTLKKKLDIGSIIKIADAAGYTIVKKNWFNGLQMPAIVIKKLNGKVEIVRKFFYKNFLDSLS